MRRHLGKAGIAAAGLGLVLGATVAAAPDEQSPEARAYLGFSFGGATSPSGTALRDMHYGLRVDHDSRFADEQTPPSLIKLDFTRRGLNDLSVHGLSAIKPEYRLRQAEETAAEEVAAEEGGFFDGILDWFGDFFGGDEDEVAETEEAAEEEAPMEEAAPEGAFLGYNAIDWGLIAVGAAGLGFAATEVVDGEDKLSGGGTTTGGTTTGGTPCVTTTPIALPPGCTPLMGSNAGFNAEQYLERQRWLDGGTGQMGDLGG